MQVSKLRRWWRKLCFYAFKYLFIGVRDCYLWDRFSIARLANKWLMQLFWNVQYLLNVTVELIWSVHMFQSIFTFMNVGLEAVSGCWCRDRIKKLRCIFVMQDLFVSEDLYKQVNKIITSCLCLNAATGGWITNHSHCQQAQIILFL